MSVMGAKSRSTTRPALLPASTTGVHTRRVIDLSAEFAARQRIWLLPRSQKRATISVMYSCTPSHPLFSCSPALLHCTKTRVEIGTTQTATLANACPIADTHAMFAGHAGAQVGGAARHETQHSPLTGVGSSPGWHWGRRARQRPTAVCLHEDNECDGQTMLHNSAGRRQVGQHWRASRIGTSPWLQGRRAAMHARKSEGWHASTGRGRQSRQHVRLLKRGATPSVRKAGGYPYRWDRTGETGSLWCRIRIGKSRPELSCTLGAGTGT
jgi:hypothetical protein